MMDKPELEWKPIKLSQKDLDFMEHQRYVAQRIATMFGLSLRDLGIVDGSITVPVYRIERERHGKQAHP
jgi:phage portal protein BeeE